MLIWRVGLHWNVGQNLEKHIWLEPVGDYKFNLVLHTCLDPGRSWQILIWCEPHFRGWGQPCKVDRGRVALPPAWKSCKSLGAPRRRRRLRLELGRVGPCQGVHTESEGPLLVRAWEAKIHTAVPRYSDEGNYEDEVDSKLMIMGVRMAS